MKDVRDAPDGGTSVQMAAIGPQDEFLTIRPELSLFAHSWDRYGAFAVTPTPVHFPTFQFDARCRVEIPRSGDLLRGITLEIRLPQGVRTTGSVQNKSFLRRARLLIDDNLVQDLEGVWFDILEKIMYDRRRNLLSRPANVVHVPLRFVRDLPLVAMWQSKVYVEIELAFPQWLRAFRVRPEDVQVALLCDFVDVDDAQRAVMLNSEHTIMFGRSLDVDALSYDIAMDGRFPRKHIRLDLSECNVPCAFLAIVAYAENDRKFEYLDAVETVEFLVDGAKMFESRPAAYHRLVQPYQHSCTTCLANANVLVHSFGLRMSTFGERTGPGSSGTFNLAGVRSPVLALTMAEPLRSDLRVKAFVGAVNWLRVARGFAAPVFA